MIYRLGSTKQTWSFGDFLGSKLRWLFSVLERNLIVMESIQVHALAASKAKGKLEPFEFSLGSLRSRPGGHHGSALRNLSFGSLDAQQ